MNLRPRGFTLIELLVAIAIVGVLSAITISALNVARARGMDAQIKANIRTVRSQVELDYSNLNNSYNISGGAKAYVGTNCSNATDAGTFFIDPTVDAALKAIASVNGSTGSAGLDCGINSSGSAYSIVAQLTQVANTFYCADNTGYASNLSKAYNQPYTALTGVCTSAGNCAAHSASGATVCQ